jgi:hypothetical protein
VASAYSASLPVTTRKTTPSTRNPRAPIVDKETHRIEGIDSGNDGHSYPWMGDAALAQECNARVAAKALVMDAHDQAGPHRHSRLRGRQRQGGLRQGDCLHGCPATGHPAL